MVKKPIVGVRYLGDHPFGIMLSEAPHRSLQKYIDLNRTKMPTFQRWDLCEQATEAVARAHSKSVIHSDLRPENLPVHDVAELSASIWLSDFGGSTCTELQLDGGHLPDIPFSDPRRTSPVSVPLFTQF